MATYPIPVFHFQVEWGGTRIGFTEVSGLSVSLKAIDYREGSMKEYNVLKLPGMREFAPLNLKRGVFAKDNEFFQWLNTVTLGNIERRDLTISLLNENHEPVMVWKVKNAFPTKVDGGSLKSTGNEIAVESIELVHEGLTIETP